MPKIVTTPPKLKPYLFHGLDLSWTEDDKDANGDCPFCGKESKFSVKIENGVWRCWVCGTGSEKGGGEVYTFLRELHAKSMGETTEQDWRELAEDRKLLNWSTLKEWGMCKSSLTDEWLLPGRDAWGKISQLYRWVEQGGRRLFMPTPTLKHQMLCPSMPPKGCKRAWVLEGPWDAMVAWELARSDPIAKGQDWRDTYVCAASTCSSFPEHWAERLPGDVSIMFDNDHPKNNNGHPAGWSGALRVAKLLASPKLLCWGDKGWNESLPSGTDVRDWVCQEQELPGRIAKMGELLTMCKEVGQAAPLKARQTISAETEACDSWDELIKHWRKALKWTDGLDRALSVMLASITSTMAVGDQLWIKVIGPASCGKSTLCEAVSTSKHIIAKSTIRGFHSGWGDGEEDHGLISQLNGKSLVTKDGDTLLQAPNLGQILSEARDLYDTTSRSSYRKKGVSRDYKGVRMTWILCGTSSLRQIDSSELGERFLDCVIMEEIDEDLEDEILTRVAHRAEANLAYEADGTIESQHDPDLLLAMRLTGGYVDWLRAHAQSLLTSVKMDGDAIEHCKALGRFVACMRARPSKKQEESAEREFAARLVSQHVRLAKCLAAVLGRKEVDAEVLRRTTAVALDTARGRTVEMCRILREAGEEGLTIGGLATRDNQTDDKERTLLRFLRKIKVVELYELQREGMTAQKRWRLTPSLMKLWDLVVTDGESNA